MHEMTRILMIDFFDSFTFNIVSEIEDQFQNNMIKYKLEILDWNNSSLTAKVKHIAPHLLIWGPGPGLINEYEKIFSLVKWALASPKTHNLGICLGHQLLLYMKGLTLERIKKPVHGVNKEVIIPPWKLFNRANVGKKTKVQFYNSWMIQPSWGLDHSKYWVHEGEVIGSYGENFLTYQFHPESVGTQHPAWFFGPVLKVLCHNFGETSSMMEKE